MFYLFLVLFTLCLPYFLAFSRVFSTCFMFNVYYVYRCLYSFQLMYDHIVHYGLQYTLCNSLHCISCTLPRTVYGSTFYTMYSVHYALHTVHCTLYNV